MTKLRCLYCDENRVIENHVICSDCLEDKKEELGDDFDKNIFKRKTRPKDYTYFDLVDDLKEADRKRRDMKKAEDLAKRMKKGSVSPG